MRLIVHDFSGHPFQAELSRGLAEMGHDVEHVYARQYVGGKGHLTRQPNDPRTLSFRSIEVDLPFQKYAPLARIRFELAYAKAWIQDLRTQDVDAVVACNLPLFATFRFARWSRRTKLPWVFWHQDLYSAAMGEEARRRLPGILGTWAAKACTRMERYCARTASHTVAIGEGFRPVYSEWSVPAEQTSVIPNWAPLDEVYPVGRHNRKSDTLFPDKPGLRLVYAGTLGRKHNPSLLISLLDHTREAGIDSAMVVISEGEGADALAAEAKRRPELALEVLPFEPADALPDVLGSADVLVALLEPEANLFSIPSKVLSYMAAGRPVLGLMPRGNPAAADIRDCQGLVVDPSEDGVRSAVGWLSALDADPRRVQEIGALTRRVAEERFDVARVRSRFEEILSDASTAGSPRRPA